MVLLLVFMQLTRDLFAIAKFLLKVDNVAAVRMSDGRLFHTAGPATQNARLPRRRLVRGNTRSPRAAERADG